MTEVARREPVDLRGRLDTLDDALRVSDVLSKSELVPAALRGKPASVFHVIVTGQALGLHWTEALRVIYSPGSGQIGLRGSFLLSQLRKYKHRYTWEEGDGWCAFTITRSDEEPPGNVYTSRFTQADAERAGLLSRENYRKWGPNMYFWRAVSDCVGKAAPELSLGFEVEPPEGAAEVQLHPETPAPPGTGQAATEDQAEQAGVMAEVRQKLAGLNESMAGPSPEQAAAIIRDDSTGGGESSPQIEPDFPLADMPVSPAPSPAGDKDKAVGEAVDEPTTVVGWFELMGYDPKNYRPQVQHACSAFARRRIKRASDLTYPEEAALRGALRALWRRDDELAPVTRLADAVDAWVEAWRAEDPEGLAVYEAAVQRG